MPEPAAPDAAALHAAVERLAARLRSLPQRRLQAGAAAEGLALARGLARDAQLLEFPDREPYSMPEDGVFAVGDQLAVAGHDLARALAGHPDGAAAVLADAVPRVAEASKVIG